MAEASNTHKERVRLLLWVLENLGKAPGDEWAAYEREMDEARRRRCGWLTPTFYGRGSIWGTWSMGRHLAINTAEVCHIDGRPLNRIVALSHKGEIEAENKHDNSGREISGHSRSSSNSQD